MPSPESNAQNALRSTGPRTPEGKATASRNSVRSGAYSEAILILGEDPAAFEALHDGIEESLNPVGPLEESLVDRLSRLWWRLERVGRAEREGLKSGLEHELRRCKLQQVPDPVNVAYYMSMVAGDGHHSERLQRHENQLERSFFRLLHELERIQARRKGQAVMPPTVVDVNLNGV